MTPRHKTITAVLAALALGFAAGHGWPAATKTTSLPVPRYQMLMVVGEGVLRLDQFDGSIVRIRPGSPPEPLPSH
jgi:hypothetical protein